MGALAPDNPPIRVLRLLSRMNVGGPSLHVLHLARDLERLGFRTRLAVGQPQEIEGSMIDLAQAAQLDLAIIPGLDRPIEPWRDFTAFANIVRQIRHYRPHIVHTHTAKAGILGRLAATLCRVPVVVHTFHGHVFTGYFDQLASRAIVSLERFLARLTDVIITLTPNLREDLIRRLRLSRPEKVRVIPLGLDLERFLNTPRRPGTFRAALGLPPEAILLGVVARLVPVKNHLGIIDVFSNLAGDLPNLHLAIVGGGEMEGEIRARIAARRLESRVHLTGIAKEIEGVYADLDLLVLASRNEGTPVVLIEALAAGCPVAATDVGGVTEVLEEGRLGGLVRPDFKGFRQDLRRIIGELPERTRQALAYREPVARRFSVDNLVRSVAGLYGEVLARRGLASPSPDLVRR